MDVLEKIRWQNLLFGGAPSRLELLSIKPVAKYKPLVINVYRNHGFEAIASLISSYFYYFGHNTRFVYSAYDDSFSFTGGADDAKIDIIWIDYEKYLNQMSVEALISWWSDRLSMLRKISRRPIFVNNVLPRSPYAKAINLHLKGIVAELTSVRLLDIHHLLAGLGDNAYDERLSAITGMNLSNMACLKLAHEFAVSWIGPSVLQRVKTLVLDLDFTLYDGVLGEDGIDGISITNAHKTLHQYLMLLHKKGFLLTICTKNEIFDVERLFKERNDFWLPREAVSVIAANWETKSDNIKQIAKELRVGVDALLFVDDNIGELCEVGLNFPDINMIHASSPTKVLAILKHFPPCIAESILETDGYRSHDLLANKKREALEKISLDTKDYYKRLGIVLTFFINPMDQIKRISELSNKTNQFNTTFLRLTEPDIASRINNPGLYTVITVRLQDMLANSGVILAIVLKKHVDSIFVEEVVISCRALGRKIEVYMLLESIKYVRKFWIFDKVIFPFKLTERNYPAKKILEYLTEEKDKECYILGGARFNHLIAEYNDYPITVTYNDCNRMLV